MTRTSVQFCFRSLLLWLWSKNQINSNRKSRVYWPLTAFIKNIVIWIWMNFWGLTSKVKQWNALSRNRLSNPNWGSYSLNNAVRRSILETWKRCSSVSEGSNHWYSIKQKKKTKKTTEEIPERTTNKLRSVPTYKSGEWWTTVREEILNNHNPRLLKHFHEFYHWFF